MKRHPEKALNAAKIRNAKPGKYADGNGLYLTVEESGSKRWTLRTVIKGKRHELGLGGLSVISLAEAREEAARLRRIARKGGDPLAERRQERKVVPTFEKAARETHASRSATFKARHANRWLKTLEDYTFPVIGGRPVDSIEPGDVLKVLMPIWTKIPETAGRVKQRMRTVFDYAKVKGWRSGDNPVDGITEALPKHNGKKVEHHAALPYSDVPAFLEALRQASSAVAVKLAFEFTILTAARTSEVLQAKWEEIDFNTKTWTVPAERMKAKVEHRVPLSSRCLEVLATAKEAGNGGEFIFPGRTPNQPLSNMSFLMALRRMNRADITPHGFRSTFRDWAEERTKFKRNVVEKCLAHTLSNKVEESYQRSDLLELRRPVMEAWAAYAMVKPSQKVVRIREA